MRGHNHAELLREFQSLIQLAVVDPERPFVSEKNLKRTDPSRHDLAELLRILLIETRYAHVIGVVARRFAGGLFLPKAKPFRRAHVARRTNHLDHRRRPADQRRLARCLVSVLRERPHERQIDVDVRIDEAGKDILPARIDHFRAGRRIDVAIDMGDALVLAVDVSDEVLIAGDDLATLYEQAHKKAPSTKHQAPEKLQTMKLQEPRRSIDVWCLMFLWSLELGAWRFIPRETGCALFFPNISDPFTKPARSDDFLLRVKLHAFFSLNVQIAVE